VDVWYSTPVGEDGADAVELLVQSGQRDTGSRVPQVQSAKYVDGGSEQSVFQNVRGEVVVGNFHRQR